VAGRHVAKARKKGRRGQEVVAGQKKRYVTCVRQGMEGNVTMMEEEAAEMEARCSAMAMSAPCLAAKCPNGRKYELQARNRGAC